MTTLVTGASGFLGRGLVRALLARGERVVALYRRATPPAIVHKRLDWRPTDLGGVVDWARHLEGVQAVYHLAWSSLPQSSTDAPADDAAVNIAGTLRLLEAMRGAPRRRFVFAASGGTAYGDVPDGLCTEDRPSAPLSAYGVSKLAVENYLALFHRLEGLDYVALRLANPYGPEQETGRNFGVVGTFVAKALKGETLTIFGDGTAERDFIYVDDAIAAFLNAVDADAPASRVYNIGSGEGRSVLGIAAAIEAAIGRPVHLQHVTARKVDPHRTVLSAARAAEIGWRPAVSFDDGLARVIDAHRAAARAS